MESSAAPAPEVHESLASSAVSQDNVSGAAMMEKQPSAQVSSSGIDPAQATTHTVDWASDPENPQNWPSRKRVLISASLCFDVLVVMLCSSVVTPAIDTIAVELGQSDELVTATFSVYVLACALGPMVLSPLSEAYGRNPVYRLSWVVFTLFQIGCALAKNIQTLLICRVFAGLGGSVTLTLPAGSMADIWSEDQVGIPVGLWGLMAYLGPVLGPICGGYLTQSTSWRWIFWLSFILAGAAGLNFLWIPETRKNVLVRRKALRLNAESSIAAQTGVDDWVAFLKNILWRPIQMLFVEPILMLLAIYIGFTNGIFYIYFAAYPIVYRGLYHMTIGNSALPFVAIGLGMLICAATSRRMNAVYVRLRNERGIDGLYPEGRLPFSIVAAVVYPASLFWFAWTANGSIHWIVSVLAGVPFGWSLLVLMVSLFNYITDTYLNYAASAIAAASLVRSLLAAAFPLFTKIMYTRLQPHWAGTLLGCLSALFMPIPFLFYRYGPFIRSKSKYTLKDI